MVVFGWPWNTLGINTGFLWKGSRVFSKKRKRTEIGLTLQVPLWLLFPFVLYRQIITAKTIKRETWRRTCVDPFLPISVFQRSTTPPPGCNALQRLSLVAFIQIGTLMRSLASPDTVPVIKQPLGLRITRITLQIWLRNPYYRYIITLYIMHHTLLHCILTIIHYYILHWPLHIITLRIDYYTWLHFILIIVPLYIL